MHRVRLSTPYFPHAQFYNPLHNFQTRYNGPTEGSTAQKATSEILLRAFINVDELSLRRQQNRNRRSSPVRQGTGFELNASPVFVNDGGT
jgi:hypothetical protein